MNANELADELKDMCLALSIEEHWEPILLKAATMLRQQHDEIIKLKLEWQYMYDRANMESTNEPVAWMHKNPEYPISKNWSQEYNIPLYTHPAELTDEEINDIYDEWQALSGDPVKLYELFKLKAQEK